MILQGYSQRCSLGLEQGSKELLQGMQPGLEDDSTGFFSKDVVRVSKMILQGYSQLCSQGLEEGSEGFYEGCSQGQKMILQGYFQGSSQVLCRWF